jgi:hypothetical protein
MFPDDFATIKPAGQVHERGENDHHPNDSAFQRIINNPSRPHQQRGYKKSITRQANGYTWAPKNGCATREQVISHREKQ